MMPPDISATARLTVDLGAVARNYSIICTRIGPHCRAAGVIKADAYGLGMKEIWAALESQGCPLYFVATPDEALALRALTKKPAGVLGGVFPGIEEEFIRHNLWPVLNSLEDIARWQQAAVRRGLSLPAIVHFDTGMNRLGLPAHEAEILCGDPGRLDGVDVKMIMSHFACADEADSPMNAEQAARFDKIAAYFPQAEKSLANSSGIFRSPAYHHDLVRPGMALYGLNPTPEESNPMQPVVTLATRILQVKAVRAGETVGYGASYKFDRDATVATVALGYADGVLRSLGNKGTLYYEGRACPVVGRISMDLVTVAVEGAAPQPGQTMEVLGPHQSADDLAAAAGTIGYEILTALGRRYQRHYKSR